MDDAIHLEYNGVKRTLAFPFTMLVTTRTALNALKRAIEDIERRSESKEIEYGWQDVHLPIPARSDSPPLPWG